VGLREKLEGDKEVSFFFLFFFDKKEVSSVLFTNDKKY